MTRVVRPILRNAGSAIATAGVLALAGTAAPATAQEQAAEGNDNVIIVTAQKREQDIQDVTAAVTAIGGEELTERGVTDFSQIAEVTPSIDIRGTGANGTVAIRGIGTSVFSTSAEPAVLTVIDDLAVLQAGQAFTGLNDIERVEVLRGPQGTLFGKGASAGVVNIVTRSPSDRWEGSFNAQAIFDGRYRLEAAVSGPVTEGVGVRVSGFYNHEDGYIRNLVTGTDLGNSEGFGFRGKIRLDPTDNLRIDLTGTHNEDDGTAAPATYRVVPAGARAVGIPVSSFIGAIVPGPRNREVRQNFDGFQRTNIDTISGRVELDLGSASLISITGYQDWSYDSFTDFDGTTATVFNFPPFNAQNGVNQGGPYNSSLFSQELRVVSGGSSPLNYLLGAYYADGSTTRRFLRSLDTPLAADWDSQAGTETMAVFGELGYMLPSRTELTAGLRYNHEEIDVDFQNFVAPRFGPPPANNATCLAVCSGSSSDDVVTYKFAVRQELSDDVSLYGSYSTGYKGGAYDVSSGFNPARALNPARPENSDAFELGLRSLLFNGDAQFNVTLFQTDYDDFQSQAVVVPDDPSGAPEFQLTNVGKLRTRGVEAEFRANPVRNLQLSGFVTYIDATIQEYPAANCYTDQTAAQGCIDPDGAGPLPASQDLAGAPLNNVPDWRFNLYGRYDIELDSAPFNAFVQADLRYQTSVITGLTQDPLSYVPGYGLVNMSVGFELKEEDITLTLFVNNLFDTYYNAGVGRAIFHDTNVLTNVVRRDQERQFGVRISGRF